MKSAGHYLETLVSLSEKLITKTGTMSSWLNVVLVLVISTDVLFRYFFDHTSVWVTELEWHFFSIIFLLGAAYTMQEDGHVRVDVFFQRGSARQRKIVNLTGHLFLLIPMCLFLIPPAWDYFYNSWIIGEGSGDPGGMPILYPIKAVIPIAFVLVLAQAVAESIRISIELTQPKSNSQHS